MDTALNVKVDPSGARRGAGEVNRALDSMRRSSNAVHRAMGSLKNRLFSVGRTFFHLKTAIITVGIGLLAKSFIQAASTAEQFQVRLRVLLGSMSEGNRLFRDMAKFAGEVPFEYEHIMGAATQLAGIMKGGVDEIKQWMPLIGDLAAVSGLSIQQTTEQVVRMYSAGAAAADLFRERGIIGMLGFQAGVSTSAVETRKKLMEEWKKTDSQFRGATALLAKTWEGGMSMLSDKWFAFRNTIMEAGLFDWLKALVSIIDDELGGALESSKGKARGWVDSFINVVERMVIGVAGMADVLRRPVVIVKEQLTSMWDAFRQLPDWVQSVGIVGAFAFGLRGFVVLGVAAKFIESIKNTARWWAAYQMGQISFSEWWAADNEQATARIQKLTADSEAEMTKLLGIAPRDGALGALMFGNTDPDSFEARVKGVFDDLHRRMQQSRREREEAEKRIKPPRALVEEPIDPKLLAESQRIYDETRTAAEKFTATIIRLNELMELGPKKGGIAYDTYVRAVQAAQKELDEANKKAKEGVDIAKELGMSFSSAFEDAIVEGKNLGEVLRSLEKDIIRIVTRKLVTEPMANWVGETVKGATGGGGILGGLGKLFGFANGGSFMVGGSGGTDSQTVAFRASPNERVTVETPSQQQGRNVTINNTFHVAAPNGQISRESQQQTAAMVGQAVQLAMRRNT